jgi:hypothetical protein
VIDVVGRGPCPHCGKDIAPDRSYTCDHCGGQFRTPEEAAAARRAGETLAPIGYTATASTSALVEPSAHSVDTWLANAKDEDLPGTLIRTYPGRTQHDATELFAYEARLLALRGYQPTAQSWADGRPGIRRVVTVGMLASSLRPDGSLTVTYVRNPPASPPAASLERDTKRCPDCAEDVLADARLCRFCRHEFWPSGAGPAGPPSII